MAGKTDKERIAFAAKIDTISKRLMSATGLKNKAQLGRWLFKSDATNAMAYFNQAIAHSYFNYGLVIDRCVEDNLDLNEIFGNGRKTEDYDMLEAKYQTIEKQVGKLIEQNGKLLGENAKIGEEFRTISNRSQELMLKYMEMVNKVKK
jgi:hypothetical protein